jgi:hypothetical protein
LRISSSRLHGLPWCASGRRYERAPGNRSCRLVHLIASTDVAVAADQVSKFSAFDEGRRRWAVAVNHDLAVGLVTGRPVVLSALMATVLVVAAVSLLPASLCAPIGALGRWARSRERRFERCGSHTDGFGSRLLSCRAR